MYVPDDTLKSKARKRGERRTKTEYYPTRRKRESGAISSRNLMPTESSDFKMAAPK